MRRVMVALLGVAGGFAWLVAWLELGRTSGATGWATAGVFGGTLAIGYPTLYRCCKRQWWECWRFLLIGGCWGALCALPFAGGTFSFGFLWSVFVLAGVGLGLLFWLTAIWRNDDLTGPKSFCLPCGVYKVARGALRNRNAERAGRRSA